MFTAAAVQLSRAFCPQIRASLLFRPLGDWRDYISGLVASYCLKTWHYAHLKLSTRKTKYFQNAAVRLTCRFMPHA